MTATVVSLDARRVSREPACGCPRHRLEALTVRALQELATTEGSLLVDRELVAYLVDDLVTTVRETLKDSAGRSQQ